MELKSYINGRKEAIYNWSPSDVYLSIDVSDGTVTLDGTYAVVGATVTDDAVEISFDGFFDAEVELGGNTSGSPTSFETELREGLLTQAQDDLLMELRDSSLFKQMESRWDMEFAFSEEDFSIEVTEGYVTSTVVLKAEAKVADDDDVPEETEDVPLDDAEEEDTFEARALKYFG